MPRRKRKLTAAGRAKLKKKQNDQSYSVKKKEKAIVDKFKISSVFLKSIIGIDDWKKCKTLAKNPRLLRKKSKPTTRYSDSNRKLLILYKRVRAAVTHYFFRSLKPNQKVPPYLSADFRMTKNVSALRSYKKKMDEAAITSRLFVDRQRKKVQYQSNKIIQDEQKAKCRKRYQTDSTFRKRESTRMRTKYQENVDIKERESTRSRLRYQKNTEQIKPIQREQQKTRRKNPVVAKKNSCQIRKRYHEQPEIKAEKQRMSRLQFKKSPEVESKKREAKKRLYQENSPVREKKKNATRTYREKPEFRQREKLRSKVIYRECPEKRARKSDEAKKRYRKKKDEVTSSFEKLMTKYFAKISQGPTYICTCCGSLCYEESTKIISFDDMRLYYAEITDAVIGVPTAKEDFFRFCCTCHGYVIKNKVPRTALSNGLAYPEIPDVLKGLTRLEQRCVALRIPFMLLRELGSDGQVGLKGNVVNVENNLDKCMGALPRNFDETAVTQLKFKRRLSDKGHYIYDKIRPQKVVAAVRYLLTTPVYQRNNATLNENWDHFNKVDDVDFIVNPQDVEEEEEEVNETEGTDVEADACIGAEETLFFTEASMDPVEVHIAPGEGNVPIPLYADLDAENLAFPCVYGGQDQNINPDAKLSYADIAKKRLTMYDRRACFNEMILYIFKVLHVKRIRDAFQVCLRQKKSGEGRPALTAKDIRDPKFLENTINADDGYTVYKQVRSTPAYWKNQVKRVVAMVRQLGNCSVFLTLSAAETKWTELLVILMKVVKGKDITEEEAEDLPYETKRELISSDPVTCARHFDHKLRALKTNLIMERNGIFAPHGVVDHYSRIEYQMRGSPHSHGLYWIKDAPKWKDGDEKSSKAVIEFVDKFITCARDEEGDMKKLINYQNHRHSDSCRKYNRCVRSCRFHYPKPPLPRTMILLPLSTEVTAEAKNKATSDYTIIEKFLQKLGRHFKEIIPFTTLLKQLNLSENDYIMAVRSTINVPTVFLRRETNAIFINNYNKDLLLAWRANMDIQFILDPYACAKYCVGYILKAEGGMSKLLRQATNDAKRGNKSISEQLVQFGTVLITGTEISTQEASGFTLGLNNTDSSRTDVFVNTSRASGRIGMLRPQRELDELPDDSEDICMKGLIHRYTERPEEMEQVCLAEFAAWYQFTKKKRDPPQEPATQKKGKEKKERKKRENAAKEIWLKDGSGLVKRRTKAKILRYRHFSLQTEPVEFYREQLMLFLPWRNESIELDQVQDTEEKYKVNVDIIKNNSAEFFYDKSFDEDRLHEIVASTEREVEDDEMVTNQLDDFEDERYAAAEITGAQQKSSDILTLRPPKMMAYDDYCNIMRSLNVKQRRIVNEILHRIKTAKQPFHIFLSGGAGVGKSHVIKAIVQGIMYFKFYKPGSPDDIPVVVCAPTGKAAFNVSGVTMHCAFKLTAAQAAGEQFVDLDAGTANSYRVKYKGTELYIIDEISMAGGKFSLQIDGRMKQIFHNQEPYGNKSFLYVGDFRQLPPIPPVYIFQNPLPERRSTCPHNPLWRNNVYFYELDEIMRQKDDFYFCKALNAMARGEMDTSDIELMQSLEIRTKGPAPPEAVYLFRKNDDCADYNRQHHSTMNTNSALSTATDVISGPGTASERQRHRLRAQRFKVNESDGMQYEYRLQVGALYMITTNICVADGLFNGSTGILRHVEFARNSKGERMPIVAWLEFEDIIVGQETRMKYQRYMRPSEVPAHCVPIERITRNIHGARVLLKGHDCARSQIPMIPANAITICKSQGSSLPKVVVNTRITKLDRQNLYVACSRATSSQGLYIDGLFKAPNPPPENDIVLVELKRLRDERQVQFSQLCLAEDKEHKFKIYFQNIRSFNKYKLELEADQNVIACGVVALVEPHIHSHENPQLEGYERTNFVPCGGQEAGDSRGSLVFVKPDSCPIEVENQIKSNERGHFIITAFEYGGAMILVCYKHPTFSKKAFLKELELHLLRNKNRPIILVGDLNIDVQNIGDGHGTKILMQKANLTSRLGKDEWTTDNRTQIDVCFSNMQTLTASTYETYYSDHRGICVMFN